MPLPAPAPRLAYALLITASLLTGLVALLRLEVIWDGSIRWLSISSIALCVTLIVGLIHKPTRWWAFGYSLLVLGPLLLILRMM